MIPQDHFWTLFRHSTSNLTVGSRSPCQRKPLEALRPRNFSAVLQALALALGDWNPEWMQLKNYACMHALSLPSTVKAAPVVWVEFNGLLFSD